MSLLVVAQVPKSVPSPKASPVEKKLTKEKRAKKFNINVKTLAKDCIVVSIQLSDTFAVVKQKIVDEIERVAKEKERELLKELEKKSKSTRNRKEDASSLETLQLQQLPQAGEEFSDFRLAFDGKELEDQQTVGQKCRANIDCVHPFPLIQIALKRSRKIQRWKCYPPSPGAGPVGSYSHLARCTLASGNCF